MPIRNQGQISAVFSWRGTAGAAATLASFAIAWAGGTLYAVGNVVKNGGLAYGCVLGGTSAASGGPTGKGPSIADGAVPGAGCVWCCLSGTNIASLIVNNTDVLSAILSLGNATVTTANGDALMPGGDGRELTSGFPESVYVAGTSTFSVAVYR